MGWRVSMDDLNEEQLQRAKEQFEVASKLIDEVADLLKSHAFGSAYAVLNDLRIYMEAIKEGESAN